MLDPQHRIFVFGVEIAYDGARRRRFSVFVPASTFLASIEHLSWSDGRVVSLKAAKIGRDEYTVTESDPEDWGGKSGDLTVLGYVFVSNFPSCY